MIEEIIGTSLGYDKEERTLYRVNPEGKPEVLIQNCKYFKYPILGMKVYSMMENKVQVGFVLNNGTILAELGKFDEVVIAEDGKTTFGISGMKVVEIK